MYYCYQKFPDKDADTPESTHGSDESTDPITLDKHGRVTEIRNADGSTMTVEYEGINSSANKIATTNKDGSTVTYEKTGNTWTETTQTLDGATKVTEITSYGTYEQTFDPSGELTTVVRRDNTTGETELISYINGSQGTLLVYPTNNPDSYSTPII